MFLKLSNRIMTEKPRIVKTSAQFGQLLEEITSDCPDQVFFDERSGGYLSSKRCIWPTGLCSICMSDIYHYRIDSVLDAITKAPVILDLRKFTMTVTRTDDNNLSCVIKHKFRFKLLYGCIQFIKHSVFKY